MRLAFQPDVQQTSRLDSLRARLDGLIEVCGSDILTSSKYVDSKTGKVVEAKLKIARLSSDAVPSVFPNCPAYLSAPAATSREAPADKRMRLEAAFLRDAIANSLHRHDD
ncbi:hypothetical protein HPB48_023494 [Haemaphysalis longicornis]|uniref:Uncharacterized protein n=1 Tax=Haemaphysalis longicornis TaxID=44386 RepID=A0A9J6H698_HAELO|nr:hypothetical protein HPB48_023494 [Haemaphysalis longicornis]